MAIEGFNEVNKGVKRVSKGVSKVENNSGAGANTQVPEDVAKTFNWGAFFLHWIWGIGNKTYITFLIFAAGLLAVIPLIGFLIPLGCSIWFGLKGNEWAWQNKQWQSVEHFHEVQKTWAIVGLVLAIICVIITISNIALMATVFMNGLGS